MQVDYIKIGRRITEARLKSGLTPEQAAALSRLSLSYYDRVERGGVDVKIPALLRIARALNATLDDFFCDFYLKQIPDDDENELSDFLGGCSEYDRRAIIELARAMKAVLKKRPTD